MINNIPYTTTGLLIFVSAIKRRIREEDLSDSMKEKLNNELKIAEKILEQRYATRQ